MQPTFRSLLAHDATREQLEEWCRARAQAIPVGHDLVLCRVLGKHLMYCLARDCALTPHLALDGIWEPWVTMAIARHVRPGMRCLDVGACYGYYAILMADIVGAPGHVEAWEPYHDNLLRLNASLNGGSIEVHSSALGMGADVIVAPPPSDVLSLFNAGGVEVVPALDDGRAPPRYQRRVSSGYPTGTFDFVKIDVEGDEAQVWDALGAFRQYGPVTVCLEFTPEKHADPEAFLLNIEKDGFRLGTVGHDGTPRACSIEEALQPDTGGFRMLWLKK